MSSDLLPQSFFDQHNLANRPPKKNPRQDGVAKRKRERRIADLHPFAHKRGNDAVHRRASYVEPLQERRPTRLDTADWNRCNGCGSCQDLDDHQKSKPRLQSYHNWPVHHVVKIICCPRTRYAIYLDFCDQLLQQFRGIEDTLPKEDARRAINRYLAAHLHLKAWHNRLSGFYNEDNLGLSSYPSASARLQAVRDRLAGAARQHGLQV
jgi:hypothetical protein